MNRPQLVWTILLVIGAAGLIGRAAFSQQGMGREYVRVVATPAGVAEQQPATYGDYLRAEQANPAQTDVRLNAPRTVSLWIAV